MKVFFDTNIVIDLLARGKYHSDALIAYDIAALRKDEVFTSVFTIADMEYILQNRGMTKAEAKEAASTAMQLFTCVDCLAYDAAEANGHRAYDFEDYVIVSSAKRISADVLLTRDKKFPADVVSIMTPAEFQEKFCPKNYEYEYLALEE